MALFKIGGTFTHYCCYQIEADNIQEAIENFEKLFPEDAQDMHIQNINKVDDTIVNTKTS